MNDKTNPAAPATELAPTASTTAAPVVAEEEATPKVKTTKRSDTAQVFVQQFLGAHGVAISIFTDADAVALVSAIDAVDPSKK